MSVEPFHSVNPSANGSGVRFKSRLPAFRSATLRRTECPGLIAGWPVETDIAMGDPAPDDVEGGIGGSGTGLNGLPAGPGVGTGGDGSAPIWKVAMAPPASSWLKATYLPAADEDDGPLGIPPQVAESVNDFPGVRVFATINIGLIPALDRQTTTPFRSTVKPSMLGPESTVTGWLDVFVSVKVK
jgi:hypothetical protein